MRTDPRTFGATVGATYALLYLYALGDIDIVARTAWGWRTGDLAPGAWFDMRAPLHFEPVAIADLGHLALLVSPLNMAVAVLLAALLALNVHGMTHLIRQPAQCRAGATSGLLGAVPALLSGGACCAPGLVLVIGIPAVSGFAAFSGWLVPLSLVLLLVGRWWQRRQGVPRWSRSPQ